MYIMNKHIIISIVVVGVLAAGAAFFFLRGDTINEIAQKSPEVILKNQGGDMEGHTPRGFEGMGTGLFAGDNLNPNFPEGDGVQIFITFDVRELISDDITSAVLRSERAHTSGSPFDLGVLRAEEIRYDNFSSVLWDLAPQGGFSCVFADGESGPYECDVTEVVERSRNDGYSYAQFRLLFEEAGNGDGEQDLLMFYITDSNINQSGIFELVIK